MASMEHVRGGEGDGGVTASSGGVQVRKWVATDAAAVPVVEYEVASARAEPVAVTLTDVVPPHLDPDDVGFHDDHHGDCWTRPEADAIRFEATLPANDELTTVYGVRRESIDDPEPYLDRPTVEVTEVGDRSGSATTGAGSTVSASPDAVDERLAAALDDAAAASSDEAGSERGDAGSGPGEPGEDDPGSIDDATPAVEAGTGASTEPAWDADPDAKSARAAGAGPDETLSLDDPKLDAGDGKDDPADGGTGDEGVADGDVDGPVWGGDEPDAVFEDDAMESTGEGADRAASEGSDVGGGAAVSGEGVLADLARELRSDGVDAETKEALARELNLQLSASSSQFVEHLQSRTKEKRGQLAADIERLEDSIAELYGLKADSSVVSSVREQTADAERVEALSASLSTLSEAKADAEAVAALEEELASLEAAAATTEDLGEARSSLQDRIAALDAAIEGVDERAASEAGVEELAHGVADLDDRTPDESAFESLRANHEALASDAAMDADLAGVERELAELDESLSAELERVESRLAGRVDEDAATRADELERVESEVERVAERSATTERVANVETDLERRYVTEADVTDALESRLRTSLFARTLLVGAGGAVGAGGSLVGTGVTGGVVLVVLGLAGLAYWWWLNESELDASDDAVYAEDADDVA